MSDLDRALADINAIKNQMARAQTFRGYGPATFLATAILAVVAGVGQAVWLPSPAGNTLAWLAIWVGMATVSGAVIGWEMVTRSRRMHSALADEMLSVAVWQFMPSAVAGGAITAVLAVSQPQALWMLPGLWQIAFALGVFASCRFLPKAMAMVGFWYLGTGLVCLAFASGPQAFAPWAMAAPFALGQTLVAAVLRFGVEGGGHE